MWVVGEAMTADYATRIEAELELRGELPRTDHKISAASGASWRAG